MLHRIVSILTILALIACPMFCGEGTAFPCGQDDVPTVSSGLQQTCSCCCHKSDQPQEVPHEIPERSDEMCQGICGGVVMLESVRLDTRDDLLHAVPFEVVSIGNCRVETLFEQRDEFAHTADSSGRSLRTMLSTYLC